MPPLCLWWVTHVVTKALRLKILPWQQLPLFPNPPPTLLTCHLTGKPGEPCRPAPPPAIPLVKRIFLVPDHIWPKTIKGQPALTHVIRNYVLLLVVPPLCLWWVTHVVTKALGLKILPGQQLPLFPNPPTLLTWSWPCPWIFKGQIWNWTTGAPRHVWKIWDWPQPVYSDPSSWPISPRNLCCRRWSRLEQYGKPCLCRSRMCVHARKFHLTRIWSGCFVRVRESMNHHYTSYRAQG